MGTSRVSVIRNVGPVTCGTVTRGERTAARMPVHRMVRDRAVPSDEAGADAEADVAVGRPSGAGAVALEQAARMAPQRIPRAARMLVSRAGDSPRRVTAHGVPAGVAHLRRSPLRFGRATVPDARPARGECNRARPGHMTPHALRDAIGAGTAPAILDVRTPQEY